MNKKTIIVLTIISCIVSLAYTFLVYYGYIRFFEIKKAECDKYITNYKNLPKCSENNKVVITLSVDSEEELEKLKPILSSFLDQTVKVDMFALNLPRSYKNIPEYIKKVCNIFYYDKNYTKQEASLIPTLFREKECNTNIIIIRNNNKIFGKDFIETIVTESEQEGKQNTIIEHDDAILIKPTFFGCDTLNRNSEYDSSLSIDKIIEDHSKNNQHLNLEYKENFSY